MSVHKVYDYVNTLISQLGEQDKWDNGVVDFSILCDRYPIPTDQRGYRANVLYVSLKSNDNVIRIYPDRLKELELTSIQVKSNGRRRLYPKMGEFFINGNTEELLYKEYPYYNHSIEVIRSSKTKELINQLRSKYEIIVPEIFVGMHQDLILE